LALLGLLLSREAPAEDLLVELSLTSGERMEGERIEYQDGEFRLFRSGKPYPVTIPFGDVNKVAFVKKEANREPAPTQVPQVKLPKPQKRPKPYKLPPRAMGALTQQEFRELEKEYLYAHGRPLDFLANIGRLVNHLIAEGKLEEAATQYEQRIRQAKFQSKADVRLRILCIACLERLKEKERLDAQVKGLRERYGEESRVQGIDHLLEKFRSGDLRPRWPRPRARP